MDFNTEIDYARKSLRKAVIRTVVITILALICIGLLTDSWIKTTIGKEQQNIRTNLIQTVTLARNSIELDLVNYRIGSVSRNETLEIISAKLRQMTYKDAYGDNYIFLVGYDGNMLVQPFQPELENTNQWDMVDTNGLFIIRELVRIGKASSNGDFLIYSYNPPNSRIPEEKMSFAIAIPELDCVIGSGMYMKKYYANQTLAILQTSGFVIFLIILILGNIAFSLFRSSRMTRNLEVEIRRRAAVQEKLFDSELNLRTIFHSMSDAILIHNVDGTILEVNDPMLRMYRVSKADIIGKSIEDISAPGEFYQKGMAELWSNVLNGGKSLFEYKSRRMDSGEVFYVEVALRNAIWEGKSVVLAVIRDIASRKQIERELQFSQKINEHAEDIGLFGHYSMDMDSGEVSWSKGLYRIFGRNPELPAPKVDEYLKLVYPEDVEMIQSIYQESLEKVEPAIMLYRILREKGELRYLFLKSDWLAEGNNRQRYIVGAIQDVTEIRKASESIRQSEEKFRSIIEQMSEGFILIDERAEIVEWNNALEQISGTPADQILGKKIWDIQSMLGYSEEIRQFSESFEKDLLEINKTGNSDFFYKKYEATIRTNSGEERVLLQNTFPIKTPAGFHIGIVVYDVTEQTIARNKLAHEMRKLGSLRQVDTFILERSSINKTLNLICTIAVDLLKVDGAVIIANINSSRIVNGSLVQFQSPIEGFIKNDVKIENIRMVNLVENNSSMQELIESMQSDAFDEKSSQKVYSAVLPLFINKRPCGYFKVYSHEPIVESTETRDFFIALAGQTSLALENRALIGDLSNAVSELEVAYEETIAGWSKALELRDKETKGHSDRVTGLAVQLARKAGFPEEKMVDFQRGVKLHDIGKMGIPDAILLKPGKLTDEDWLVMKEHPKYAYDLLSNIPYLKNALEIPYGHHERWDGSGYPQAQRGEDIPLSARIFAVVDVWDALRGVRPYKQAWDVERVKNYLIENKGILFDPHLVDLFLEIVEKDLTNE